jgi:hypothetical protein
MARNLSPIVANIIMSLLTLIIAGLGWGFVNQQQQIAKLQDNQLQLQRELPKNYVLSERYSCDYTDLKKGMRRLEDKVDDIRKAVSSSYNRTGSYNPR